MAKVRRPSHADIVRYGERGAALKAALPRKKWNAIVREARKRGVTIEGAFSGAPRALQERTPGSIRQEAERLIARSYRPADQALDAREQAANNLAVKRREDEDKFAQWLSGEYGKLEAQARAADETLLKTQTDIANDAENARKAANADSLRRMAQTAGTVSDPGQSTALDMTAADAASAGRDANARAAAAGGIETGEDVRQLARSAMSANVLAARSAVETASRESINDIFKARTALGSEKAQARASLVRDLMEVNRANAQRAEEMGLAAQELGIKRMDIASQIREADRKFNLETKKFNLDRWVQRNKALAEQAKIQLGYDRIASTEGQKAADRALRKWISQHKQDKKAGISNDEREAYANAKTAWGFLKRWHSNGRVPPGEMRQKLREMGTNDAVIDLAEALRRSNGAINGDVRRYARLIGIKHVGYFFGSSSSGSRPDTAGNPNVAGQ